MSAKCVPHRASPVPRTTILLALASLVLLPACQRTAEPPAAEIRPVRVTTIEQRSIGSTVTLTGRVQAQSEINQSFRIDGKLIERTVDIGDKVVPGQLIARLDPMNEESNLQSAKAQLAAAKAQWVEAQSHYARMLNLITENAVSRASFEQAEARLKVAQSQVDSVQSLVELAQNRLSYTRLVANAAGVVTARGAEPGEVVPAGRMIIELAREDALEAVFDVPGSVKDSAPANPAIKVALSSDPEVTAVGRVYRVAPRADPVTGTFRVQVRLRNAPAAMRLGSTVTGHMQLDSAPGIDIPTSALIRSNNQTAVWVVDPKTATLSARAVEVRAYNAAYVQIESGLAPGDVVVTAGAQALRPGQQVRLLKAQP